MNSFSILKSRQVGLFAVAGALLLALILPSIVSAAQLTNRSIELSSSSVKATGVSYKINFTPTANAAAYVVDFCTESPLIGDACTTPSGFSASAATGTGVAVRDVNTLTVTQALTAGTAITPLTIAGITNPTNAGTIYARIITYNSATNANLYDSAQATSADANRIDEGGAAIAITNTIGVSGAVLESMTFCVSKVVITQNCTGATAPVIKLGQTVGSVTALTPTAVSEGTMFTQLSTNAANGAVVSLKSSTVGCGGLLRAGFTNATTDCDIRAAGLGGTIAVGEPKFGVKTATATDATGGTSTPAGTLQASTGYSASGFTLNYAIGDATGVTSTFGDPFLNTDGKPVNNKNMQLTFGASISNNTPAGLYSADLSLIATGKF
jgi:hypothetical protein